MAVEMQCPTCAHLVKVSQSIASQSVLCPKCKQGRLVPTEVAAPARQLNSAMSEIKKKTRQVPGKPF